MNPINHGTNAGYHQHRRYGVPTCAECKAASNEYDKLYGRASSRALRRLRDLHPDEYKRAFFEELTIAREELGRQL
ncbi:MAG TPA: hypothetical protein VK735_39745 [Pseudonocardia sp.]|uniref:hypothetical protein n=1 Tax=Pseudonocardia sp. TaxID=60912 RepID=UPI002C30AEB5|nr:hypothetical protein [Pseudonocardia sp.]HTF53617.1 hypothetical protein [Pseudonocardia sp.]